MKVQKTCVSCKRSFRTGENAKDIRNCKSCRQGRIRNPKRGV